MDQSMINAGLALVSTLIGIILKAVWDAVKDLQSADTRLAERVGGVEVMVAGAYVTRDELRDVTAAIFKKLDSIELKLDRKVDK